MLNTIMLLSNREIVELLYISIELVKKTNEISNDKITNGILWYTFRLYNIYKVNNVICH